MQKIKEYFFKLKNFKFKTKHIVQIYLLIFLSVIFAFIYINMPYFYYLMHNFKDVFAENLQLYSIYVGQGDCSLLVFPDKTTMLIDTGTSDSTENMITEIETILKVNDKENIDYLILTHPNADHIGGAIEVLDKFEIKTIYRPCLSIPGEDLEDIPTYNDILYHEVISKIYEKDIEMRFIEPLEFTVSDFLVKFWTPNLKDYTDENSYSPIMTISNDNVTLMFTGDATKISENEFLEILGDEDLKVDFLKVAHHGSKNSSTMEFLSKIKPTYAIISAGYNNAYKFPSQEVIDRLKSVGTREIYTTNELGTIGFGIGDTSFVTANAFVFVDKPFLFITYFCLVFSIFSFKSYPVHDKAKRYINFINNNYDVKKS